MCADGYFEQFGKCVACPSSHGASVAAMLGILALLVVACVVFFRIRYLLPVDVLKLGLSMLQVRERIRNRDGCPPQFSCPIRGNSVTDVIVNDVSLSLQIIASASTAYSIPWPPSFNSLLSTLRIFLVDVVSITRTNCAQPMTYYGSLMTLLIGT